jgi:hypothetical protein
MNIKTVGITLGVVFVVIFTMYFLQNTEVAVQQTSPVLDEFAQCLTDSGAIFYGAYWCSHCNAQKREFGASAPLLPYVECATSDGDGQSQTCKEAGIEAYPTWVFPDGSRQEGRVPLTTLAEKTQCELPFEIL